MFSRPTPAAVWCLSFAKRRMSAPLLHTSPRTTVPSTSITTSLSLDSQTKTPTGISFFVCHFRAASSWTRNVAELKPALSGRDARSSVGGRTPPPSSTHLLSLSTNMTRSVSLSLIERTTRASSRLERGTSRPRCTRRDVEWRDPSERRTMSTSHAPECRRKQDVIWEPMESRPRFEERLLRKFMADRTLTQPEPWAARSPRLKQPCSLCRSRA
mmetsp:Transcript_58434/g.138990  ORF Transcript_58434/g.138990 Transcript_58434/m.138990 type:complete len:214 (+) Transcript_58434:661-1302(+)